MTLAEAEELLNKHNISFEPIEYETEKMYWQHAMLFPYTANAKPCKVTALVIKSKNDKKDIELQFNAVDHEFVFEELRFGGYCYEMFDIPEDTLPTDLIEKITEIMQGNLTIIVLNDLKKKRWNGDACFDRNDDDDVFGEAGFQKALQRIENRKSLFTKLFRHQKQYEIYDWNTYRCVIK